MTEKKAKTATPHLRETPEQRQQVEHEDAIEDAGKDGKLVDPLNSAFLTRGCYSTRSAPTSRPSGSPPPAARSAYVRAQHRLAGARP
jgi:hypothetical protein